MNTCRIKSFLSAIPKEITVLILSYVSQEDVFKLCKVSMYLKHIIRTELFMVHFNMDMTLKSMLTYSKYNLGLRSVRFENIEVDIWIHHPLVNINLERCVLKDPSLILTPSLRYLKIFDGEIGILDFSNCPNLLELNICYRDNLVIKNLDKCMMLKRCSIVY